MIVTKQKEKSDFETMRWLDGAISAVRLFVDNVMTFCLLAVVFALLCSIVFAIDAMTCSRMAVFRCLFCRHLVSQSFTRTTSYWPLYDFVVNTMNIPVLNTVICWSLV